MTDMFSPGATLRAAREKRKLSVAEVADGTRIKIHVVKAIENNDFSGIAAPLYGKGFIKLYAEFVGIDPEPLIRDYLERHARVVRPSLKSGKPPAAPTEQGVPAPSTLERFRSSGGHAWRKATDDVVQALSEAMEYAGVIWARWRMTFRARPSAGPRRYTRGYAVSSGVPMWRYAAIGVASLVTVVLIAVGIGHLLSRPRVAPKPASVAAHQTLAPRPLRLAEEPPASYIRVKTP